MKRKRRTPEAILPKPREAEVLPGEDRGVICVQGEQKRTVAEAEILDALYEETVALADRVTRGEVVLSRHPSGIRPE